MFGLREAGVLGASVLVAGGVAYLIWNYTSSSGEKKPETRPGAAGKGGREDGQGKEEEEEERREEEQPVKVPAAAAPVPASEAPVRAAAAPVVPASEAPVRAAAAPVSAAEAPESRPAASAGTQVLVLGLDGSGKSSLLQCFATGGLEQDVEPTQGFNAVSINREELHIEFLEIGGTAELRPYWRRYMSKALLLVFVVDSCDARLFPVAKQHLHELLESDRTLPLMVLANKQDLPGACSITDLHDALSLSEVGERRLFLIGTSVQKGVGELSSGVQDARDLIIQMVCDGR